jgi:hypothetical protein
MSALANPRKGIRNYHKHSYSDASRRMCQQGLIGAQKFTICDSLLEHAVVASFARPKSLIDMCEIGIPCFHNMWIEWNEVKRIELLRYYGTKYKYYPKDHNWALEQRYNTCGERIGYHIFNDKPDPHFCYSQYTLKDDQIHVPPMSFSMINEGIMDEFPTLVKINSATTKAQQAKYGPVLLGNTYSNYHKNSPFLEQVYYKLLPSISNAGNMVLPQKIAEDRHTREKIAEQAVLSYRGDMRFIIAVMALLNYPHTTKERKLETSPQRFMFGKKLPRNELRVMEIDLPKPRGVTRYERMFKGGGGKKRRHVRRGHWHTYVFKNGERIKKWVEEQWCGDAALGTITHDYELKNKQSH